MLKFLQCFSPRVALLAAVLALSACNPTYNWREVRSNDAPFVALFPDKPAVLSRQVNLDGLPLTMTMTAAEVDGVTFAVGSAQLPEQVPAPPALNAMKTALVRNIGGSIRKEKSAAANQVPAIEIEASGLRGGKEPMLLLARFTAKDQRIYQVIVVGPEKAVSREAADTFFTSFKLN